MIAPLDLPVWALHKPIDPRGLDNRRPAPHAAAGSGASLLEQRNTWGGRRHSAFDPLSTSFPISLRKENPKQRASPQTENSIISGLAP